MQLTGQYVYGVYESGGGVFGSDPSFKNEARRSESQQVITPALHNAFVRHGPLFHGDLIDRAVYRETGNLATLSSFFFQ